MNFIDEAVINLLSGSGGRGCVSFRREKYVPRGGPDGGDGGKGGDIVFKANSALRTLYYFRYNRDLKSKNGSHGRGKCQTGKNGLDLIIEIPTGTLIKNADTNLLIADLDTDGQSFTILRGGIGGRGNARFKSSTNRAPRYAQPGEPGQSLKIKLELKLLADVGIIGLPNAGKSTLISAISSAKPEIAGYPFTTLWPNLGVVNTGWGEPFVAADIPGLIKGAHKGAGLGIKFLKHIERTRLLVHVIDAQSIDPKQPLKSYHTVENELAMYNKSLLKKDLIVALNKIDIPEAIENAEIFESAYNGDDIIRISALQGSGINRLISLIAQKL